VGIRSEHRFPRGVDPHVRMYAALGQAWRGSQPDPFATTLRAYRENLPAVPERGAEIEGGSIFQSGAAFITIFTSMSSYSCSPRSPWLIWPESWGARLWRHGAGFRPNHGGIWPHVAGGRPRSPISILRPFSSGGSVGLC